VNRGALGSDDAGRRLRVATGFFFQEPPRARSLASDRAVARVQIASHSTQRDSTRSAILGFPAQKQLVVTTHQVPPR
jgi:hypothetical protein